MRERTEGDGERETMRNTVTTVEGEGAKGGNKEREEDTEGAKWRENVFNYSALPMFPIYGLFRAASRSYIYTHTVGTG